MIIKNFLEELQGSPDSGNSSCFQCFQDSKLRCYSMGSARDFFPEKRKKNWNFQNLEPKMCMTLSKNGLSMDMKGFSNWVSGRCRKKNFYA